jgi:ATP-dependent Clp protease ATP-binding subunit ClpB
MTSNIGSHIIQDNFEKLTVENKDEVLAKTKSEVYDLLKKSIRPEFLNRIDEVIMFEPLSREDVTSIVRIQFNQIKQRLAEQNIAISITDEAVEWLAQLGYDPQFGARPVKRVMQKQILNELSKQILAGTVNKEKEIVVDMFDKQFVFRN